LHQFPFCVPKPHCLSTYPSRIQPGKKLLPKALPDMDENCIWPDSPEVTVNRVPLPGVIPVDSRSRVVDFQQTPESRLIHSGIFIPPFFVKIAVMEHYRIDYPQVVHESTRRNSGPRHEDTTIERHLVPIWASGVSDIERQIKGVFC
jgi:hypothetical protein